MSCNKNISYRILGGGLGESEFEMDLELETSPPKFVSRDQNILNIR
jgi:hypothetical protein